MMHRTLNRVLLAFVALAIFSAATISSQKTEKKKRVAISDASKAGPDFAIQGEYSGEIVHEENKEKVGVQVIALSGGKYRAVGYPGGLPGDGWDKKKKFAAEGTLKDGAVAFSINKGKGLLKDGVLTIMDPDGNTLGKLKKVLRKSPTLGAKPPKGAVVLFDGTTAKHFKGGRLTDDGLLMQGVTSKQTFGSFTLHMEFKTPYMPYARGQGRGNSGCYFQGRYEVQILDSFGLAGKHNECGGLYENRDPDVNMCFPPLSWQTYDVDFTAAVYDDSGKKIKNARATIKHNGVVVHKDVELPKGSRGHPVKEGPGPGPVYLQNHGNPVRFRNIWLVEN